MEIIEKLIAFLEEVIAKVQELIASVVVTKGFEEGTEYYPEA